MHRLFLALALLLALVATAPGHAIPQATAGAESPPFAKVEITPSRIDWTPVQSAGYERVVLTVVGPEGFVFEKRFPRGMPPTFELGEVRDRTFPDGAYSYELRTMGKGAGQLQSGFFSVRGGSLFVPAAGVRGMEPPAAGRKPSGPPLQLKTITSSECVGDGCLSGDEGFPLRLKSPSALRLDFTDGPDAFTNNHSWAIQANDLFLGGGTYLAVKDVDNATTPFTITANAPDNALFVSSSGNVGLGTASPTDKLDVRCNAGSKACLAITNSSASGFSGFEAYDENGTISFYIGTDNANNNTRFHSLNGFPIVFLLNGTERLRFPTTGNVITAANGAFLSNGGTWTNASSRTLKQDIHELDATAALATVKGLNPVEFAYKADPKEHHVGFIAEDVPALVAENDRKGLSSMDIVAVLTKVVQEQQKTIEKLSARLTELEQAKK